MLETALDIRAIDLMSVGLQKARIILTAAELDMFSKLLADPRLESDGSVGNRSEMRSQN